MMGLRENDYSHQPTQVVTQNPHVLNILRTYERTAAQLPVLASPVQASVHLLGPRHSLLPLHLPISFPV